MKKRIIAWILLGALLLGFIAMAVAAQTPEYYQVGYAKVDINPYDTSTDDPNDLLPIPMGGNGSNDRRLSYEGKMDDNGDGVVNEKDGLFATCIAITDDSGNTLLQYNVDLLNSSVIFVNPVRQQIVQMFPELSPDQIVFNASHTHSGPSITNSWKSGYTFSQDYNTYMERLISQLVLAGKQAMEDRTPATMHKGTLDASASNAIKGDIGDTLNQSLPADQQVTVLKSEDHPHRLYNAVRHYIVTSQAAKRTRHQGGATNDLTLLDGTSFPRYPYYDYTSPYVLDPLAPFSSYVGGDNFNGVKYVGETVFSIGYSDKNGNLVDEAYYVNNAASGNAFWKADASIVTQVEHVSQVDDTVLVLEFRFADQYHKKPIVLVNWRAHSTLNRTVSDDFDQLAAQGKYQDLGFYTSFYQMSSDWVNAMRYVLERNGYRPAFLQGAAGNINPESRLESESGWLKYATDTDRTYAKNKGNIYGSELAEIVLECLDNHMEQINKTGGDIKTVQIPFQSQRRKIPVFEYLAALDYDARYTPATPLGNQTYTNQYYYTDAAGNILVDTSTGKMKVDENGKALKDANGNVYTDAAGQPVVGVTKYTSTESIIITSAYHAGSVISLYASNNRSGSILELNAIRIGNAFAMVTAPTELFDRYSDTADQYDMSDNLWRILDDFSADGHGEPFVASYANHDDDYLPSKATYSFSSDNPYFATGSYETLTSQYAPGNGEAVIRTFKEMLDYLRSNAAQNLTAHTGYCTHCQRTVTWNQLPEDSGDLVVPNISAGHYYLSQDTTLESKQTLSGANICLDLQGHTLTVKKGLTVTDASTLSILGQGTVAGTDAVSKANGGVFTVNTNGTLNLYEATFCYAGEVTRDGPINNGGILNISGTFNMYGGTVHGTTIYWTGGAAYVGATGRMNLYGGQITEASSAKDARLGDCILNRGTVLLSGNAQVDDIWFTYNTEQGGPAQSDALILSGIYNGRVNLSFPNEYKDLDIGNSIKSDYSTATITVNFSNEYYPVANGKDLICSKTPTMLLVSNTDGVLSGTTSLATAFTGCTENNRIVLLKDINNPSLGYTIPNSATLDLNGHLFNLAASRVIADSTLSVMDSATADYDISDGIYGKLTLKSGNIVGVSAAEGQDVYLKHLEEDGTLSFHAVGLNIHAMSLKPDNVGLYYENRFNGDSVVKEKVASYGVAMSVQGIPSVETMGTTSKFTIFSGETFGQSESTSSLLYGVMKPTNGGTTNRNNAAMQVYGRAYVLLDDGEYLFGITRTRSLQQQIELADKYYFSKYTDSLASLYSTYKSVMSDWQLPNLKAFLSAQ